VQKRIAWAPRWRQWRRFQSFRFARARARDGRDLIHDAYATRRGALEELQLKQGRWLTTPSLQREAGAALYGFTLAHGWEGIVAKRLDSVYRPAGRNGTGLKAKHPHARDLQLDRSEWIQRERSPILEPLIAYT
jgi:ATP-dependent DNA ligase